MNCVVTEILKLLKTLSPDDFTGAHGILLEIACALKTSKASPSFKKQIKILSTALEKPVCKKVLSESFDLLELLSKVKGVDRKLEIFKILKNLPATEMVNSALSFLGKLPSVQNFEISNRVAEDHKTMTTNLQLTAVLNKTAQLIPEAKWVLQQIQSLFDIYYPRNLQEIFAGLAMSEQTGSTHIEELTVIESNRGSNFDEDALKHLETLLDQFKRHKLTPLQAAAGQLKELGEEKVRTEIETLLSEFRAFEEKAILLLARRKPGLDSRKFEVESDFEGDFDYF